MLEINVETNPLSRIKSGDLYSIPEGQLVIVGTIVVENGGELRFEDNSDLIVR